MKIKQQVRADLSNSKPFSALRLKDIEYRDINSLTRYEHQLRKLPEKQIAKLVASLGAFGFINPIIVDESSCIVAGEARHEAALRMGLKEVPVICIEHLTAAERRAFRIADNKLSQEGRFDLEALAIEVESLIALNEIPIELTGIDSAEIDVMILGTPSNEKDKTDPVDELPQLPDVSTSKAGDIWILGDHKLLCGSSLNAAAWAELLGDEIAIHAFVDPPYNVKIANNVSGLGKVKHQEFAMASGEMSADEFLKFNAGWLSAMLHHCADGAIIDVCMDWRHAGEIETAIKSCGLDVLNICVWAKTNAGNGAMYRSQHELVFIAKKGSAPHINNIQLGKFGRYRTNVWTYPGANSFGATRMDDLAAHTKHWSLLQVHMQLLDP